MDESDEASAAVCGSQAEESFELLVRQYQERVFRLAVSILGAGREQDAEEVAQDAFLRAFRGMSGFRGDARFATWLYRITYNTALNRRKSLHAHERHTSGTAACETSAATGSPLQEAIAAEQRAALHQAMEALPDLYRTVLRLHYWLGCPVDEIAEYLDAPPGTVKSYLHRARTKLAAILTKKGISA